jgi:hypothetical protein
VNDLYKENYKLLKKRLRKTIESGEIFLSFSIPEKSL